MWPYNFRLEFLFGFLFLFLFFLFFLFFLLFLGFCHLFLFNAIPARKWELGDILNLRDFNAELFKAFWMEPVFAIVAANHVDGLGLFADAVRN